MLHGLSRGVIAKLRGGKFISGFMSGVSGLFDVGTRGFGGFVGRTVIMAVVGGTFSVLGGGKFSNGAMAAAFVHMFNEEVRKFVHVTKAALRKARALAIKAHANAWRQMHCPTCARMSMKQAYQITYAIDRFNNNLGKVTLSLVGGVALSPVAEAGYLWAMRNFNVIGYGVDIADGVYGGLPPGSVVSSIGKVLDWFGLMPH